MTDEIRIRALLEEVLESGRAPEEVCADCPELLPVVRMRLEQIRRVERGLEALFPSGAPIGASARPAPGRDKLPPADDKPMLARRISWREQSAMWMRRHPVAAAVAIFLLLATLAAILGASIWWRWAAHPH